MFATLYYALIAWALLEVGLLSWKRPERLDSSWSWTRPAPARYAHPIGPGVFRGRVGMTAPDPDQVLVISSGGEAFWSVLHEGATEEWSPAADAVAAEADMRILDDVDEWLAERLRDYEHELSRISCRRVSLVKGETQCTLDEELARFQDGSMALHEYRSMILDSSREFTPREHMQLEALILA